MFSAETLRKCKANEKYLGRGCHWFFVALSCFWSTFAIFFIAAQVEDLREAVLKLAAADKLRAQGFLRSEQNLPKTNKRGVTVVVWMTAPVLCTHHMIKSSNMTNYNPTTCFYSQLCQIQRVHDFVLRACRMFNKGLCRLKWFSSFVHCTEMKQNKPEANTFFYLVTIGSDQLYQSTYIEDVSVFCIT